jgi:hypothetical protein
MRLEAQPRASVVPDGLDATERTVSEQQTPEPGTPDPERDRDDTPDTPPTEPPPVPVQDPPSEPRPDGPYVVTQEV